MLQFKQPNIWELNILIYYNVIKCKASVHVNGIWNKYLNEKVININLIPRVAPLPGIPTDLQSTN